MSKLTDRRKECRYNVPLNAWTDEGAGGEELLIDFSENGCGFQSSAKFRSNEHVLIHFSVPKENSRADHQFVLHGKIVWKRRVAFHSFRYGIAFPHDTSIFFGEQREHARDVIDGMRRNGIAKPAN